MSLIISFLGFFIAFVPMLISISLEKFTNDVQGIYGNTVSISSSLYSLSVLILFYFINVVYNFFQSYSLGYDSVRTNKFIRETIFNYLCDVKYKYIENYDKFKERIAFADSYSGYRVANSIQTIIIWIQNLITFLSLFFVMFSINPWIVFILLLTCIPSIFLSYAQKDEQYKYNTKWVKEGALVIHYFFICVGEQSMDEVRHYKLYDYLKYRWRQISKTYISVKNKMTKKHVLYNSLADILRNIVYIGVLLLVANKIYNNPTMGLGVFMLIFTMSGQLQNVTSRLFINAAQFMDDVSYIYDFFDLENLEKEPQNNNEPLKTINIEFNDVSFTYPNSNNKVLDNINLQIAQGEKIAIVGENGSGKTTFINLLCGLYAPQKGNIYINSRNINDVIPEFRKSLSVVFQDFGRYDMTIKENIAISDIEKEATDDSIMELVEKTNIKEIIINQPNKLNEQIGLFSETGNNLSGGQWQKLAITRALFKNNAKLMILDEPTAALDPIAETEIYKNFADLASNKTIILISHRLGITSIVDRILVFKDGQIIEDGNHKQLMENNSYYSIMYKAQAQWYE